MSKVMDNGNNRRTTWNTYSIPVEEDKYGFRGQFYMGCASQKHPL